jgi:uncharacterized phage protein (TIGR01671 family)
MREKKFRAWDKEEHKFVTDIDGISLDGEALDLNMGEYGISNKDRKIIFQQFTGLFDKNGKEIWEGDIVKESRDNGKGLIPYTVAWNVEAGWFTIKTSEDKEMDGSLWLLTRVNWENFEVIGNIYEDSNLLESEVAK